MRTPRPLHPPSRVTFVDDATLSLSKAPASELAAAALVAREDAGLLEDRCDYLIVAVPVGDAYDLAPRVARVLDEFVAERHAARPSVVPR
jgi:hypothetical protein